MADPREIGAPKETKPVIDDLQQSMRSILEGTTLPHKEVLTPQVTFPVLPADIESALNEIEAAAIPLGLTLEQINVGIDPDNPEATLGNLQNTLNNLTSTEPSQAFVPTRPDTPATARPYLPKERKIGAKQRLVAALGTLLFLVACVQINEPSANVDPLNPPATAAEVLPTATINPLDQEPTATAPVLPAATATAPPPVETATPETAATPIAEGEFNPAQQAIFNKLVELQYAHPARVHPHTNVSVMIEVGTDSVTYNGDTYSGNQYVRFSTVPGYEGELIWASLEGVRALLGVEADKIDVDPTTNRFSAYQEGQRVAEEDENGRWQLVEVIPPPIIQILTLEEAQAAFDRGHQYYEAVRLPEMLANNAGKFPEFDMIVENEYATQVNLADPALNLRIRLEGNDLTMTYDYQGVEQVRYWSEVAGWIKRTAEGRLHTLNLDFDAFKPHPDQGGLNPILQLKGHILDVQHGDPRFFRETDGGYLNKNNPEFVNWAAGLNMPQENSPLIDDPTSGESVLIAQIATFHAMLIYNGFLGYPQPLSVEQIQVVKDALLSQQTTLTIDGQLIDLSKIPVTDPQTKEQSFIDATKKATVIYALKPEGMGWIGGSGRNLRGLPEFPIIINNDGSITVYVAQISADTWAMAVSTHSAFSVGVLQLTSIEPDLGIDPSVRVIPNYSNLLDVYYSYDPVSGAVVTSIAGHFQNTPGTGPTTIHPILR